MPDLFVKKNGVNAFEKSLVTRESLRDVMTTANPGAKTVESAIKTLGGIAYVESFESAGSATDTFEVYEGENLMAKATRKVIAAKMRVALTVKDWAVEIFTDKSGTRKSADKGQIEVE